MHQAIRKEMGWDQQQPRDKKEISERSSEEAAVPEHQSKRADAAEAEMAAACGAPDVLLDLGLPGEDGLALTRHIRSHSNVGIIIVTGSGNSSDSLTNAANWTGGFPGNGSNVFLVWTRTTGGAATKTVTNSANQFFFADSLSITNQSTKDTVFITFNGQTFLTNGAGALLFAGASSGASDITLIFSNNLTFNTATYAGGAGNSTLSFAGGTIRGSNLTFTGGAGINRFLITAPTVSLSSNFSLTAGDLNNTLIISSSTVTVAGRLTVAGNQTDRYFTLTNASLTVSNGVLNTGKLDVFNLATLNVTRDWTNNGVLAISAGGTVAGGTLTNQTNGTVTNAGFITAAVVNQGQFQLAGTLSNTFRQTAGTNTLFATSTITGNATVDGGLFNLNGQTLTNGAFVNAGTLTNAVAGATVNGGISNAATINVTANTFLNGLVTNTGGMFFQGAISNTLFNAGSVTLNNAATITTANNTGTFNLNGQTLNNTLFTSTGVLTNAVTGATLNGALTNAGTFAVTADTFVNAQLTNTGAVFFQGAVSNRLVNSGSFNLNNAATFTVAPINTGTLNADNDQLTITPAWINSGTVVLNTGTLAGGNLTNNATVRGAGTLSNLLVNAGSLVASNGTLTLAVAPNNTGSITVVSTLNVLSAWTNAGFVSVSGTVSGGNLTNLSSGTITNLGAITPLVVNQGRVVLGGSLVNFIQTAGTNTVSGSGSVTGTATISGGLFDLAGGTYSNGLMILSGSGVLTSSVAGANFSGTLSNAATVNVTAGTFFKGIITNTGVLNLAGAVSNNLINAGTVQLSGAGFASLLLNTGTITNTGAANLTGLAVTLDGTNASDFTGGAPGVTTLAPGASTTFTITFNSCFGARSATAHIASNDQIGRAHV